MRTHRMLSFIGMAILLAAPRVTWAQNGAAAPSQKECEKAARTVDHGHPAKKLDPALATLEQCPKELAQLYVATLADLRTSRDTAELGLWSWRTAHLRDGTIFAAVRDQVRSSTASAEARTFALITMQLFVTPTSYTPFEYIAAAAASGDAYRCTKSQLGHNQQLIGATPMPPDAAAQFRATVAAVLADPGTPALLRFGAGCM